MKLIGIAALGFASLLLASMAWAQVPAGATVAETKEQVALLGGRLHELLKESSLELRGVWLNAVDPVRQAQLIDQFNRLAPDKRDQFYDAEFTRALAAFGDVKTKPFCVFGLVPGYEPLLYGNRRYMLPSGAFASNPLRDSPRQPGQFGQVGDSAAVPINVPVQYEVNGRSWDGQFEASRMNGGYEAIVAARKEIGEAARYRTCFRYVRLEDHPERARRGVESKWLVLEWLSGDVVDNRSGRSVLAIPTTWAAL